MNKVISIIGAGHLGGALARGLIKSGYTKELIHITNRNPAKVSQLVNELNIEALPTNCDAVAKANVLILAVKPQFMQEVCEEIALSVQTTKPLIISLAGVTQLKKIHKWLGTDTIDIVRVMTNTPMEFCKGVAALFAPTTVSNKNKNLSEAIFSAVGSVFWVDKEQLLDPLTAAIGCAPAYALLFMEALQKAAASQEVPEDMAKKIALDVIAGTVTLVEQSERTFAELRAGVTTPNGVTEYSLQEVSTSDFFSLFKKVYSAAKKRIEEIKNNI